MTKEQFWQFWMQATKTPNKCKDSGLAEGRDVFSFCVYFCSECEVGMQWWSKKWTSHPARGSEDAVSQEINK